MTDAKVTIIRETMQAAIDALECALSDSRPYIVKSREVSTTLRAALAAQPADPNMDTVLRNAARRSATIVDRGRMVQPVEPVAWLHIQGNHTEPSLWRLDADEITRGWTEVPLYAAPPAPAAVPMTDERIVELFRETFLAHADPLGKDNMTIAFARAIERAHSIAAGDKLCGG